MDEHSKAITPVDAWAGRQLAPVVAQVLAANPTPEVLGEILKVQRDWEAGEARKEYTRALVELKRDLPPSIRHDKEVSYGQTHYTHTSLAAAMEAVTPALTQHGFSLTWEPKTDPAMVTVTCRLTHEGGHSETCTISSKPDSSGQKGPAQQIASTITYLQRYTALALLGIATSDMAEPHGPRESAPVEPDLVDKKANMELAGKLRRAGLLVSDAEAEVGATVTHWTAADLVRVRGWARSQVEAREPGAEG
jgi:hypothetical protein